MARLKKYYFDWEGSPLKSKPHKVIDSIIKDYTLRDIPITEIIEKHPYLNERDFLRSIPFERSDFDCNNCKSNKRHYIKTFSQGNQGEMAGASICLDCGHSSAHGCLCDHCVDHMLSQGVLNPEWSGLCYRAKLKERNQNSIHLDHLTAVDKVYLHLILNKFMVEVPDEEYALVFNTNPNHRDARPFPNDEGCTNCSPFDEVDEDLQNKIKEYRESGLIFPSYTILSSEYVQMVIQGRRTFTLLAPDINWHTNVHSGKYFALNVEELKEYLDGYEYTVEEKFELWNFFFHSYVSRYFNNLMSEITEHDFSSVINSVISEFHPDFTPSEALTVVEKVIVENKSFVKENEDEPKSIIKHLKKAFIDKIEEIKKEIFNFIGSDEKPELLEIEKYILELTRLSHRYDYANSGVAYAELNVPEGT